MAGWRAFLETRAETIPNDGMIRYMMPFGQERVLLTSPKALSEVLVTRSYDFVKPRALREALSRLLGVGVLVAEGDEHRFQRKLLMPAFAFRHIKDLYPVFWEKSGEAVRAMTDDVLLQARARAADASGRAAAAVAAEGGGSGGRSGVIEAGEWASRAALDIIGVAGLGRDFGTIRDPDTDLGRTYRRVFSPNPQAARLALLTLFLPRWVVNRLPVQRNNDIGAAARTIRSVCADLIRGKRSRLAVAARGGGRGRRRRAGTGRMGRRAGRSGGRTWTSSRWRSSRAPSATRT